MRILDKIQKVINEKWIHSGEFNVMDTNSTMTIELFENPTSREIKSIIDFQEESEDGVRLGFSDDDNLYAWDGAVWHETIIDHLGKQLIRLAYLDNKIYMNWRTAEKMKADDRWDVFMLKVKMAFPNLKEIVSEHHETIWSK